MFTPKVCGVIAALALLTDTAGSRPVQAQTTPTITFEVASIRRNKEVEDRRKSIDPAIPQTPGRAQTLRGGNLLGRGMTVKELIRDAYGFRNRAKGEVLGGPAWLDTEVYDIQAKADVDFPASTTVGLPPGGEMALRALLAERFHLKAHLETQRRPIYELILKNADGKLGPKLTPSKGGCRSFFQREAVNVGLIIDAPKAGEPEPEPPCLLSVGTVAIIQTTNMPLSDIARLLSMRPQLNRTVVDKTGLTGGYDIQLMNPDLMEFPATGPSGPLNLLPPLKPLLESQLGLTLREAQGDVEVLVIDSIEHPTEN